MLMLVICACRELLESHYLSCLKEADVLKHRGLVISAMQKKDHNQLWQGLINDKFDQFWAVNRRLMEPYSDQESFKNIPVRFYFDDVSAVVRCLQPLGLIRRDFQLNRSNSCMIIRSIDIGCML